MKKKIIIIIILLVLSIITFLLIKYNKKTTDLTLIGRWTSVDNTLIKIVKEYKDGEPIYVNDNIVGYWLDIKKNGKYNLYYNDVSDKSRSNFSIEKNLIEKGKYNRDTENENIIYFSPSKYDNGFIWTCEIKNNKELHNCNSYAYDFIKQ